MDTIPRIIRIEADNSYSAGVRLGESLGRSFDAYLEDYIAARILAAKNCAKPSETHAVAWTSSLPHHICDRFRGLSEGSGVPFERISYWGYLEMALSQGCSSIICRSKGKVWIGHNNDTFVPKLWGYITVLEIKGRIPTMYFGLAGDIWATSGINKAKLWLHVDYLQATDKPDSRKAILPTYGFIIEALETCENIDDVRDLLNKIDRTEGMILIVADGKTDEAAIFECSCSRWRLERVKTDWAVRTNHAVIGQGSRKKEKRPLDTWSRYNRLAHLLENSYNSGISPTPSDLKTYLADDGVERREEAFATAYSVVVCPAASRTEFTLGGQPAASCGNWSHIEWPWHSTPNIAGRSVNELIS